MRIKTRIRRTKIYIEKVYERLTPFFNILRTFSKVFICGSNVHYTGYNYAFSAKDIGERKEYMWKTFLWKITVTEKLVYKDWKNDIKNNGKPTIIFTRWVFTKYQCYTAILDFKKLTTKDIKWKYNDYLLRSL